MRMRAAVAGKVVLAIAACLLVVAVFVAPASSGVVTTVFPPSSGIDDVSLGAVTPGPATLVLLTTGLLGLGGAIRRRLRHS